MLKNETNISLLLSVWLASNDSYDLVAAPNLISASTLQKPIRALVLGRRAVAEGEVDIDSLVANRIGTTAHTALEEAWLGDWQGSMARLGYSPDVVSRITVNPVTPSTFEGAIDIYLEKRTNKEIDGYIISGKFDAVIDGVVHDLKTTKSYSYITGTNDKDYRLQCSIYRWLNPTIITEDYLNIEYLFTDWSSLRSLASKDYPPSRCLTKKLPLFSIPETELYLRERIAQLKALKELEQDKLPLCNQKELWQEETKYAYYKTASKTQRATKLFDSELDAQTRKASDGHKGKIVIRKGQVKRCNFCAALSICTQAEQLKLAGLLKG